MIKIFELFAGIGAPRKALINLGIKFESLGYSEIDRFAIKSYQVLYNDFNNFGDITKIKELPRNIDILFHGSPCQDFSIAGKGEGAKQGTRSNLMFETVRLVKNSLPKVIIWENVKGVLSTKHRPAFDKYLSELEKLGYTNYWQVLNAKDYEIPQNRERVFVVSKLDKEPYVFPKKQKHKYVLEDFLDHFFTNKDIMFDPKDKEKFRSFELTANSFEIEENYFNEIKTIANVTGLNYNCQKQIVSVNGISPTLNTCSGGNKQVKILQQISFEENNKIKYDTVIRKLKPLEYWRLMGFCDDDFYKCEKVNSNSQLYKQAGNSIVVNVLMAILKNLIKEDKCQILM